MKIIHKLFAMLLALALLLSAAALAEVASEPVEAMPAERVLDLAAEGEASPEPTTEPTPEPTAEATLTLNAKRVALGYDAESGQGMAFQIVPSLSDGSIPAVTYTGYDENIVRVSPEGEVVAVGVGKTKVTARTDNKKKARLTVRVKPAPGAIALNAAEKDLETGKSFKLKAKLPSGTCGAVAFASDDTGVATVEQAPGTLYATVTAVGSGEATVTATCFNGAVAACVVRVLPDPARIELTPAKATLGAGEKLALAATPLTESGAPAGGAVTFASSNSKVAAVSRKGVVTAKKAGSATITAVGKGGVKATCAVQVVKAPASVQVQAANPKLSGVGATTELVATLPAGSASAIAYSYDEAVLQISAEGQATAVGPGTTTVTARIYNGKTGSCVIRVLAEGEPRAVNVAHRGGSGYWPENTLEAFRNTESTGATAVELDARTTKDGVQVVHHDAYFTAGGKKYTLASYTMAQLQAAKPSLCTLAEAIDVIRETHLEMHLELKDTANPEKCVALVREHGMADRTVYISFNAPLLARVRKLEPDARLGYIINDTPSNLNATMSSLRASYIFQKADYLTRANIVKWQNKGAQVGVWTINDAAAIKKWLDMGVDFLTSNYPKLTTEAL